MAISFYAVKLSDNMAETPEGYLLFFNAVIARTGLQSYKGSELPQRGADTPKEEITAQDLGVEANDTVSVYRSAEEVFSPKTLASFEMKSITDTHPDKLLTSETVLEHECGQIFNVRKGKEALEDGNWPLLADGIVKDKNLVLKIKAGLRELSCGYNYHIVKDGTRILMVDILGNHVAVVPNGRAGPLAAIQDSAIAVTAKMEITHMSRKETLKNLLAMGLKVFAVTAEPKDLAVAMDAIAADAGHSEDCKCSDCKPASKDAEVAPAKDAAASDARKRMHDALDKMLDGKEEEQKAAASASDEDAKNLAALFGKDADVTAAKEDATDAADADEDTEEESEEETEATDEAVQSEASPIIQPADRQQPDVPAAVDAAFKAGQDAVLKALKPFVAKSNDARLRGAFDTATKLTRSAVARPKGGYGAVLRAAGAVGKDHEVGEDPSVKANAAYKAQREAMRNPGKR